MLPLSSSPRTVGARLREAREQRGVSLRQIAARTRISVMSLEALERSDFSRLPGGIFTRAFIRAYAQEVGLDPDRTIQDFVAELPAEAVAAEAKTKITEDGEKLESDRKAVVTAIRLVLISIPLAGLVVYYGTHRPAPMISKPPAVAARAPAAKVVEASAAVQASQEVVPPPAAATSIEMDIAPKAECWVSVTVDGEPVFSGLMKAGENRHVSARDEISLNVGDAGAFNYSLNGKEGRALGAPGEVVSKRIALADLKDYIIP